MLMYVNEWIENKIIKQGETSRQREMSQIITQDLWKQQNWIYLTNSRLRMKWSLESLAGHFLAWAVVNTRSP